MEFTKETLKVKIYGSEYELSFPKLKASIEFRAQIKECEDDEICQLGAFTDFLGKHGLPKEVVEELQPDHLTQIVDALNKKK